ncbi:MAG: hypothetical protein ACLR17_02740 [Enterobacteriaceae bacterium]
MINDNFRDQLAADVIISIKPTAQRRKANAHSPPGGRPMPAIGGSSAPRGGISTRHLDFAAPQSCAASASPEHAHGHGQNSLAALSLLPISAGVAASIAAGLSRCGWILTPKPFSTPAPLLEWARLAPVGRVKGVMRIAEGVVRINRQQRDLHIETQNVSS